ncbi:thermonuclease family protein [Tropicimonas sp. TH_r6]|uniref:thermonuclease family protein n=1 Tax=Tropicimonas sp. TH_r6 TaxID=3082085 RepID=UPI002954A172|nr:thermonuclease family protein [Tropicimonas sp. TH_r6]MDV7145271.1 thermonuclease family protein [Tropicimonas sp. TH_r6]
MRWNWCIAVLLLAAAPGLAHALEGRARAIDGDTLEIAGESVRLHGIDAPEMAQSCEAAGGGRWSCGRWAREQLIDIIGRAPLRCDGRERDRYGRLVAKCYLRGADIGQEMVARGAAHAYRKYSLDYVDAEKNAFLAARGLWQGEHLPPEAYRAGKTPQSQPKPVSGCAIKGNISKSGRIYHMPGQRDYAATRISESKGERWFCTEAEAQAAGWRAARR